MIREPDCRYPNGRILVFARAPVPGEVKTRLASRIGDRAAAALYEELVRHALGVAVASRLAPVELHVASQTHHPFFRTLAAQQALTKIESQQGEDLGERMCNALRSALDTADFAVLIGTDCPAMTADYLREACEFLDAGKAVVLGPAEDGGYVLIGARTPEEHLFADIPWGSERVLQLTRERLQALKLRYAELATLWDVDSFEDLRRWQRSGPDAITG
jgi:rSAM/selenodomain-associated transferase 1